MKIWRIHWTTINLSRFGEFQKQSGLIVSTLRLWSLISSPQIRQSEARCWTWISVRLIKLFWQKREKRQRLALTRKKVITRLCKKPGGGKRNCFGPRNSKIVFLSGQHLIPKLNIQQGRERTALSSVITVALCNKIIILSNTCRTL